MEKQHIEVYLKKVEYQNYQALMDMTDGGSINHWCKWHLQLNSLALGQTAFISVAGSTIHASTCKGHWNRCLNGCRSRSQAYTKSTTAATKQHHTTVSQNHTGAARHMWRMDLWMQNEMHHDSQHKSVGSRCTRAVVYLRHIHWSQTPPERTLAGRRRYIH